MFCIMLIISLRRCLQGLLVLCAFASYFAFSLRQSRIETRVSKFSLAVTTGRGGSSAYNGFNTLLKDFFDQLKFEKPTAAATPSIRKEVVIIGAGIAGLTCAKELSAAGVTDYLLLESSDAVGGRVRTDEVDGYLLDRGFQVFIDSYPEAVSTFDYKRLGLKPFLPGAMVRYGKKFHLVSDPLRRPQDLVPTIVSPIGSLVDKILVGIFSLTIRLDSLPIIFARQEMNTAEYLSKSKVSRTPTPDIRAFF